MIKQICLTIVMLLSNAAYSHETPLFDEPKWDEISETSGTGNLGGWYYEHVNAPSFILFENNDLIDHENSHNDTVVITYKDHHQTMNYNYLTDYSYNNARPIMAEKTNICNVSTVVLTFLKVLRPENPAIAVDYIGPDYGYERIFLNLEKEGELVQIFDDYSTNQYGAVPLTEFLNNVKHRCSKGFILFPATKGF